jgi:hypothetical protein
MKKLSDYKGEDAIELWGDLIDLMTPILADREIADIVKSGKPKIMIAKAILATHKQDAVKILLRIDPTPIDGLNIVIRLVAIITEIGQDETVKDFFGFAEQAKTGKESTGLLTESIEAEEN